MGAGNGCLVFIQGFLHIFQTKAMVALILFAGLEKVSLLWRRGVGDAAQNGGSILLQNEFDPFFCVSRQTLAGLDGIIKGVAEDNGTILWRNGQIFLDL